MNLRILFAEDDKLVTLPMEVLLTSKGHKVTIVYNGTDAFEELKQNEYDLLITDYMMPGLNGIELAQSMFKKDELKNIPIIFYSGALDRMPKDLKQMNIIEIFDKTQSAIHISDKIAEYFSDVA